MKKELFSFLNRMNIYPIYLFLMKYHSEFMSPYVVNKVFDLINPVSYFQYFRKTDEYKEYTELMKDMELEWFIYLLSTTNKYDGLIYHRLYGLIFGYNSQTYSSSLLYKFFPFLKRLGGHVEKGMREMYDKALRREKNEYERYRDMYE